MAYIPSLAFQQEQKVLQSKRLAGEIDGAEYSRLVDELIKKEAQNQQSTIIDLAIQEMREAELRKTQALEEEKKREEAEKQRNIEEEDRSRQYIQQRMRQDEERKERQRQYQENLRKEKEARTKAQSRQNYREVEVPGEITMLKRQYQTTETRYNYLQIISVFASIIAASMVGLDVFPRLTDLAYGSC